MFYYLLSGPIYYYLCNSKSNCKQIRKDVNKEIEYFFKNRAYRNKDWFNKYLKILYFVLLVNSLSRVFERELYKKGRIISNKYPKHTLATLLALKTINKNRRFFYTKLDNNIFLNQLIEIVIQKTDEFISKFKPTISTHWLIHGNTPLGIELEFSNKGAKAGNLFEPKVEDPLYNFSKHHHYHLTKFMWRFGAYIDVNTPLFHFFKKGGFLEYTFTKPDKIFSPSSPLTNSPNMAAELINEAVKFTPVKPHSLHITVEVDLKKKEKLPTITFNDVIFYMICTGDFVKEGEKIVESRLKEKNMKDVMVPRHRKNRDGWVTTIEFTNLRLSRKFVKENLYELFIILAICYKNLFFFPEVFPFTLELNKWGKNPSNSSIDPLHYFDKIKRGLDKEISLPEKYKEKVLSKIINLYYKNSKFIMR